MKKATFFIVTPSYNQADFIEETINSVLSQTEVEIYYYVFDANSTDGTPTILKKYSQRLTGVSEPDKGQTEAINKGIVAFSKLPPKIQNEAYFAYINSDDYYFSQAFEKVATAFKSHPQHYWLVGEAAIASQQYAFFHAGLVKLWKSLLRGLYFPALLLILNPIPQPATFLRWEAVKNIGHFNESLRYAMDYEYWLRVQAKYGPPLFLPDQLAVFRVHDTSKGGTQFHKQFAEQEHVARSFTKSGLLLGLHSLHNRITLLLYSIFK